MFDTPQAKATKQLFELFKPSNVTTKFTYLWKAPQKMAVLLVFFKHIVTNTRIYVKVHFVTEGRIFFKW
jgi:hypothetical protein